MSDRHPQSAQWLMARTHMRSAERHFGNAWKIHASPAPGGSETTKDYALMTALNDFIETVDPPSDKQPSSPKPRIGLTR